MAVKINTILNWFKTGSKPTQAQFWATWTSFWHKDEQIPQSNIFSLENDLNEKAEKSQLNSHLNDKNAHADLFDGKVDKVNGMGLTQENFTTILKEKLENFQLDPDKFQGQFESLKDLLLSHPEGVAVENSEGWTAFVMVDGNLVLFIWDFVATSWIATNKYQSKETPASIKEKYESNINTNVFDDAAKNKLAGVINTVIATDAETQINVAVPEDNKVVSRLKLFNWWNKFIRNSQVLLKSVKLDAGTLALPPLVIQNGSLTTTPQNGAIERDSSGNLHHVVGSSRIRILDTRDYSNFLTITWKSSGQQSAFMNNSAKVNTTTIKEVPISLNALGSTDKGDYLFKTSDEYLIKNGSHDSGKIPPKEILYEVYLKGNNCTFSGNKAIRLYSVIRTDVNTYISTRSYEIPLHSGLGLSGSTWYSILRFSEKSYDNLGNVSSDNYRSYYLRSLNGTTNDLKLSQASLSLEYRVSLVFDDAMNSNGQNSKASSSNTNNSSLFIKL